MLTSFCHPAPPQLPYTTHQYHKTHITEQIPSTSRFEYFMMYRGILTYTHDHLVGLCTTSIWGFVKYILLELLLERLIQFVNVYERQSYLALSGPPRCKPLRARQYLIIPFHVELFHVMSSCSRKRTTWSPRYHLDLHCWSIVAFAITRAYKTIVSQVCNIVRQKSESMLTPKVYQLTPN